MTSLSSLPLHSSSRANRQDLATSRNQQKRGVSLITKHRGLDGLNIRPGQHLVLRNIRVGTHRTSIRLEPTMWDALDDVCAREDLTIQEICTAVAAVCEGSLTSAIRAFLIDYFRGVAQLREQ